MQSQENERRLESGREEDDGSGECQIYGLPNGSQCEVGAQPAARIERRSRGKGEDDSIGQSEINQHALAGDLPEECDRDSSEDCNGRKQLPLSKENAQLAARVAGAGTSEL